MRQLKGVVRIRMSLAEKRKTEKKKGEGRLYRPVIHILFPPPHRAYSFPEKNDRRRRRSSGDRSDMATMTQQNSNVKTITM